MSRRQFLALIVPLLAVLLGFVAMTLLERTGVVGPPWDDDFARYIRNTLAYEYVGGVPNDRHAWEAYFAGLNAYVQTFDHYAAVIPPWQVAQRREESEGQYVGIGVRPAARATDGLEIIGVQPEGPAAKAGVQVGDLILAVDGMTITEISPDGRFKPIGDRIRGEKGSKVRLTVRNAAGATREVEVVRDDVDKGSVFGERVIDGIGYLRVAGFMSGTARSFDKKLRALLEQGISGLVLDLRDNYGGILPQATEIADAFLDSGAIVRVVGRGEEFSETLQATSARTVSAFLPLAVLINGQSASASEILAGALRDHGRAVLVGERTYGKFLVQTIDQVPMELGTALFKRTSSIYQTPRGYVYQRRSNHDPLAGLPPDIDVSVPLETPEWKTLVEIFENEMYADWNPDQQPVHVDFDDRALNVAVALLKGENPTPRINRRE